jgi:hypothetical protein
MPRGKMELGGIENKQTWPLKHDRPRKGPTRKRGDYGLRLSWGG